MPFFGSRYSGFRLSLGIALQSKAGLPGARAKLQSLLSPLKDPAKRAGIIDFFFPCSLRCRNFPAGSCWLSLSMLPGRLVAPAGGRRLCSSKVCWRLPSSGLCSLFLRRRWPRMTIPAGVVALSLLGLGWLSVFNALATYDELAQLFSPVSPALPGWLGSWDAAFSMHSMRLVTALMGAFFISMDLAANPVWRRRLFLTLALSGGLLLLFGLVERATAAEGIFWEARRRRARSLPPTSTTPMPAHSST